MDKIHQIDSAKDFKVYFNFKSPLSGGNDVKILVGNLAGYVFKDQRAGAPKWAMGKGRKPIYFNRGIEKLEGQCAFNVLSVDFETDFAYLLNTFKSPEIFNNLTAPAKQFTQSVFSELHRRRDPGKPLTDLSLMKDITPDEVTIDFIPEFNIEVWGNTATEVIEGVQFFGKDGSVGVSSIGIGTSYQFTARRVIPLDYIDQE